MARLDRFLVSDDMVDRLPDLVSLNLERKISDHSPILLHQGSKDYGPTSFRFYDSWMDNSEFDGLVRKTWADAENIRGGSKFDIFKNKLKLLKDKLREWNKANRQKRDCDKDRLRKKLEDIDQFFDQGLGTDDLLVERRETIKLLGDIEKSDNSDHIQKAKITWGWRVMRIPTFFMAC